MAEWIFDFMKKACNTAVIYDKWCLGVIYKR